MFGTRNKTGHMSLKIPSGLVATSFLVKEKRNKAYGKLNGRSKIS